MTETSSLSFAALVAVGPGDAEVERLNDLIAAIGHHEPAGGTLVIIDDAAEPRGLDRLASPAGLRLAAMHHRREGTSRKFSKGKGICSVVMTGMTWIERHLDAPFVVKLDTDSLIISPFRERLAALFGQQPQIGMIGAYARTPGGGRRDWSPHAQPIRALARNPLLRAVLHRSLPAPAAAARHVRSLVRTARHQGYAIGEHCLGGGYALSGEALRRMAAGGWLDTALIWATVDLPEDVMMGMHVRAVGLGFLDDVDDGGVFGVRHVGLPFPPDELVRRAYAVIHAVKNDAIPEIVVRTFFANLRATEGGGTVGTR